MRRTQRILALALALCAAGMVPALAGGDYVPIPDYRTGVNPYGAATPVPAPIPVPVYEPAWYFRGDFAAGFGSDPSVTAFGTPFDGGTEGFNALSYSSGFEPSFTGGVGVGYIWGPAIRTDLTVDVHSIMHAKFYGTTPGGTYVYDKTRFISTILLANAYYDFRTGTPFTPYLGGGLGFGVNQLTRSDDQTGTVTDSVSRRTTDVQFAAAAMAGFYYDFSSFVAVDVNYRFLYVGGSSVGVPINGIGSELDVGSLNEHQIRAGLRLYVN